VKGECGGARAPRLPSTGALQLIGSILLECSSPVTATRYAALPASVSDRSLEGGTAPSTAGSSAGVSAASPTGVAEMLEGGAVSPAVVTPGGAVECAATPGLRLAPSGERMKPGARCWDALPLALQAR
jgi:hypothetical protein